MFWRGCQAWRRSSSSASLSSTEIVLARRVDDDDVAVLEQADGPADRGFRADMADAQAAGAAGEAAVGDQRNILDAEAVERRGGRQHLAHAGAALRPFVADHQAIALARTPPLVT